MEQKLNKQRRILFLRITLILIAVWIAVSAVYCVTILYSEKNNIEKRELAKLSYISQDVSEAVYEYQVYEYFFRDSKDLLYDTDMQRNWDSQLVLIDRSNKETVKDTAGNIIVKYGYRYDADHPSMDYGYLDYVDLRRRMSDEDYERIKAYLNSNLDGSKRYELVCTKFIVTDFDIIPVEVQIVITEDKNTWFVFDDPVETFQLETSDIPYDLSSHILECNGMMRNVIPKDFPDYNSQQDNIIGLLTPEQRNATVDMIPMGQLKYIFYATNSVHIEYRSYEDVDLTFQFQYAKKIDLFELCKVKLFLGIFVFFVFLFIIAVILFLSVWKVIETQAIGEENRVELTNALAHDIKTPLFVISGYAYSLKENIDESERDDYLNKIIEQTEKINTMVHNMLNLSKLNSYSIIPNRADFDLSELIIDILEDYEHLPQKKTIVYEYSGDNTAIGDVSLITTALCNLIDNAVFYSLAETTIEITVKDKVFAISNKCEPFTKAELKQIWQPYVRRDKSRHKKGNGLGLSIVKSIFELHKLKYKTEYSDGTLTFMVDFN